MNGYNMFNDVLVNLFNEILDIEERALTSSEYKNISVNDMHILDAIGLDEAKSMSSVAKTVDVTVGTLTIAINSLVKKGYVHRVRSEIDRRVVLISLTEKGCAAYRHHQAFHDQMIQAVMEDLDENEIKVMVKALNKLRKFFREYRHV